MSIFGEYVFLPRMTVSMPCEDCVEVLREGMMNTQWSELNKLMQTQIKKEETWQEGIRTLVRLRDQLMDTLYALKGELTGTEFNAIPFISANGYHSKTIAYSIWHIARIEDIVAHTLIAGDDQVFFSGAFQERIHSPIITTGNELVKEQIAEFSEQLDLEALYAYIAEVKASTERIVEALSFGSLKLKPSEERKEILKSLKTVSTDEEAYWLIDYWCGKDIRGLIQMPFSRHWIMHIEACLRIRDRIIQRR